MRLLAKVTIQKIDSEKIKVTPNSAMKLNSIIPQHYSLMIQKTPQLQNQIQQSKMMKVTPNFNDENDSKMTKVIHTSNCNSKIPKITLQF
jgi:hypothetical protein